jgi:hypothetical protein
MQEGEREVSFEELRESPDSYRGKFYIFGGAGIIVETKGGSTQPPPHPREEREEGHERK